MTITKNIIDRCNRIKKWFKLNEVKDHSINLDHMIRWVQQNLLSTSSRSVDSRLQFRHVTFSSNSRSTSRVKCFFKTPIWLRGNEYNGKVEANKFFNLAGDRYRLFCLKSTKWRSRCHVWTIGPKFQNRYKVLIFFSV